jgi:hypothetical protein
VLRVDDDAWVLAPDDDVRLLGSALAWSVRNPVRALHLVADPPTAGVLARRASAFVEPPQVWQVDGARLDPAEPAAAPLFDVPPASALTFIDTLVAAGVDVVVEHGSITGEILGLEIARVEVSADGQAELQVGVGRHDRDAFAMVHGNQPIDEALARVVEAVQAQRYPGAPTSQALARLSPERWLRATHLHDPEPFGFRALEGVEGTVARSSVKDAMAAFALGINSHGDEVVVAFSTGIDLDLVPHAADVRASRSPDAHLVLVLPTRDDHQITRALAAALVRPADIVTVSDDWRASGHR